MALVFFLLCCVSLVSVLIGLVKPRIVLRWGSLEKKTRGKVLLWYGIATMVFFVIFIVSIPEMTPEERAKYEVEQKLKAEQKAKEEAEEKAKNEAAEKAKQEIIAKERAKAEAEILVKKEADAKKEAEEKERKAAEAKKQIEEEQKKLAEEKRKNQELMNNGINAMNNGDLEKAIAYLTQIKNDSEKYDEAQSYIETAKRDMFVEQCIDINYNQIKKNADDYKNEKVHFYGKIYNIQEINNKTIISLSTRPFNNDYIGDEVIVLFPSGTDLVENQYIDIFGEIKGKYSTNEDYVSTYLNISRGQKFSIYYSKLTALELTPIIDTKAMTDLNGRIY